MRKLINNYLNHLIKQGVSKNSLKFYKSDISQFLNWTRNRKITKRLVLEYISSIRFVTPVSTINRKLSTLRSFANFLNQNFMDGVANVSETRKIFKNWQDKILYKFEHRPKIKHLLSRVFYSRPNWYRKYHSYSLSTYIHIAILVLFTATAGYALYDQAFKEPGGLFAFPPNLTRPNRYLSFQGRLTDNLGNPKTTATNFVFKLYDASSGGSTLWNSGTCSITPDQDGIFSTLLGSSCGSEIASSVFSENASVWLGVTVGADAEATPRIQIATVAYALNAETLQGFPAGTGTSTIPYINSAGTVVLANASPKIQSTSGTFAVEGQALTITTPNTTNGVITINPDGTGTLDLTFEGTSPGLSANGFVNATNANITSGSLYAGTVASNATGYNFINFLSGASPTSKFSVENDGDINTSGDLTLSGGNLNTGNIALTIGDATTDSITLQTDGTGNGEVVLPNDSISPNEIFTTGQTDEYCLTYEATGATWEWQTCGAGGSSIWSDLTAPIADLTLSMAAYNTTFNWDPGTAAETNFSLTTQGEDTGAVDQVLMALSQTSNGVDTTQAADALLTFTNNDPNDPVINAIRFDAGAAGTDFTYGINFSGSSFGTSELLLSNSATIQNIVNGTLALTEPTIQLIGSTSVDFDTPLLDLGTQTVAVTLNNSANALNFDSNTLSIDALNDRIGIGTTGPDAKLDSLATSGEQLRLTYTDGSVYSGFTTDSNGYLIIDPTGARISLDGALQVGSTSPLAYSRFGTATTGHSGNISASNDLLISGDLELDGTFFLDGGTIANSAGTATVVFSSDPITTANTLSASNWLVENTANVGQAALMVNNTKSGPLFTASASGTTKFTIHNDGAITLATIDSTTNTLEGTIYYDSNSIGSSSTDHLFMRGSDNAWHRIALDMTKYSATNATVANQNYLQVTHNQGTNDLAITAWIKDKITNLWRKISDFSHTIKHALQNEFNDASAKQFSINTNNTLQNNLVAYWSMDETSSGTSAVTRNDSYGSNNLTDNNTTTSGTGKINNAADFESSNSEFLEIADNLPLSTGDIDFTITAWINLESETAGTNRMTIVSKHESASVREYELYYTGQTSDRLAFELFNSGGSSVCNVLANNFGAVTTSTWYFITAWHDATANTCNISVNNGTADSTAESGVPSDTTANLRVGAINTTESQFLDGLVDEVGFWKKTLSSQEKTDLYNSGNANGYGTRGNLFRTQTKLTNIELAPAIDTGTGADGSITISSNTNINTINSISGRSCADGGDAVNYSVTALTSTTATLETTPSTGCLNAGDEILLINLRGTSNYTNVGNYETLRISSIASNVVTFTTAKSKYYGDNANDDTNIGLGTGNQAVMLQRVPNYTNVTINTGVNFFPSDWIVPTGSANNGAGEGGVIFFRATGTVSVASTGTIHANSTGYIGGTGEPSGGGSGGGGEAFCGIGGAGSTGAANNGNAGGGGGGTNNNGGNGLYCGGGGGGGQTSSGTRTGGTGSSSAGGAGGGGGGNASGASNGGGGGGYGTAGQGGHGTGGGTADGASGGTNSSGNGGTGAVNVQAGGGGGGTYGIENLSKLFYGSSGGAGGGTTLAAGGDGGGIIGLFAQTISVSGGISSNGANGSVSSGLYGGGGAGGSVLIMGNSLTLGSSLVTASGGTGGNSKGAGGSGRIAVYYSGSLSGSTSPSANTTFSGYNTYGLFHSQVISTPNSTNLESIRWEGTNNPYTKISLQTRTGNTTSPTDGTWEPWKPFTVTTNYLDLSNANTDTEWTSSNLAVTDGDVTRNIDQFEDEDEAMVGNITKFYTSGFETDTGGTMDTSLISYWPLNETSGTRNDSYSTNNLTANGTGGVGSATGIKGNAADFESSESDFLEISDNAALSTGDIDFTISTWVNLESKPANPMSIVTKNDSGTVREYTLRWQNTNDRFELELFASGGTSVCMVTANNFGAPSLSTWYFITAWHDATANTCNISVNNGTADSTAETGVPSDTAANFRIGARQTTETNFFDGLIDEVGFWKKVLSSTERTDLYNSGNANTYPASNQYAEDTIAPTDISNYDYLTFWIRASQVGSTVKIGMGESAATEQEESIKIDSSNTWQKVYWDLSDIQSGARDAITKLRFTNLVASSNTIYIDNVRAEKLLSDPNHSKISSTPNNYLQYRLIMSTTNTAYQPQLENIYIVYNDGYKIEQTDSNNVRLYNYTGETQELRLDAIVFGADLAEWYTVLDPTIGPGDLVSLQGTLDEYGVPILTKSRGVADPKLVGAISTKAGKTLGIEAENRRLLGLAGRIPVKVDPDTKDIKSGDELTSSSLPGYATLAMPGDRSIGKAAENWSKESGKDTILIIIDNSYAPDPTTITSNIYRYLFNAGQLIDQTTDRVIERIGAFALLITPQIKTEIISPIADSNLIIDLDPENSTSSAKLVIKGQDDKEVASIDSSGKVIANSLEITMDATISGTLYADNIESKRLEEIEALLKEVETNQTLLANSQNWETRTSDSPVDLATYYELRATNLFVTGQTAISSIFISDLLTVNKIESLDRPLTIQSLAASPLEIMAGKVIIDTDGNTKFLGNVEVAGNLKVNNIIVANNADPTATQSLEIAQGEINSNATAGKAVLTANTEKVRINNNKVSLNTLVYITPITSTQNKVLYVKAKDAGFFEVGFSDTLDTDVEFNWWIIELEENYE